MEMAFREGELPNRRTWDYSCDYCESRGMQHDRLRKQCFRHYDRAAIARAHRTDKGFRVPTGTDEVVCDRDSFLGELARLKSMDPRKEYFSLCQMFGVCPAGLVEAEDYQTLAVEGAVREYGADYLSAYGWGTAPARLLEALEVIRSTRNEIEARKWQEMKRDGR